MNVKQIIGNILGAGVIGAAGALQAAPAGSTAPLKAVALTGIAAILANLLGLFQQPPHQS